MPAANFGLIRSRAPARWRPFTSVDPTAAPRAIFLSYASQDAETVRRICDALRAQGLEVWFDQNELVGGDAWDAKIRGQIGSCALFLPVISAATQARREGYFRIEWRLAAQRTHAMADGTPFLVPIVIDDTRDTEALVPAEFKGVQWTRLRGGETPPSFCVRVEKLLTGAAEPAPAQVPRPPAAPTARPRAGRKWIGWAVAGAVGLAAAGIALRPQGKSERGQNPAPVPAAAEVNSASPSLPSRVLALRTLNGLTRERLAAADDLLAQTLKAEPTNAVALALAAQVDALMVYRSWDLSDERRQSATKRSARAAALAPDDFESRRAQAIVAGFMVRTPASLQEAEALYRSLAAERAGDTNVLLELGSIFQHQRKFDEAAQTFMQAGLRQYAAAAINAAGRPAEALRLAEESLAERRTAAALILKANIELFAYNNREAARATVSQLTPTELREDDAAGVALRLAVLSRDAEGLLRLLEPFPHPFVSILGVNYPRQYWTGLARSWQNQPEAAEIEWRGGLRSLQERLAAKPSDADALSWMAMFQSCLGLRADMERSLRVYGNYRDLSAGQWDWNYCLPLLRFGERKQEVIDRLSRSLRDTANFNRVLYAWARYSAEFDPIRGDPQFERLLRETRPSTAAPFEDEVVAARPLPDAKSVAVLPFANLSGDASQEYFSDGLTEEILNALARERDLRVPGRASSFSFKGRNVSAAEIAKALNVSRLVEGSVRRSGNKVRISITLTRASDGFSEELGTFTEELTDIFALQDKIASAVVAKLTNRATAAGAGTRRAVNPEAYGLYLQARAAWVQRTAESYRQAEQFLHRALELEPTFAPAMALLSVNYSQMSRSAHPESQANAALWADRALAADANLPDALAAKALTLSDGGDHTGAIRLLQRSIEIDPGFASGHQWLGRQLAAVGDIEGSFAALRTAAQLDPLAPRILDNYASVLALIGRPAEALQVIDGVLAAQPNWQQGIQFRARFLLLLGRLDESLALYLGQGVAQRDPAWTARALLAAGRRAEAEQLVTGREPGFTKGMVLCVLGRPAEGIPMLRPRTSVQREMILWEQAAAMPRDLPEFHAALKEWGLADAWARAEAWRAKNAPAKR